MRLSSIILASLLASACASKLVTRELSGAGEPEFRGEQSGNFISRMHRDGTIEMFVDASVEGEWQHLDLDTGAEASGEHDWDIAFSRYWIKTNGGANGPGGVYVASLPEQSFADLTQAPVEGFAADREDSEEDTDVYPDNAFNSGAEDWFDYNMKHHELTPKDISYVIASSEGSFYKFVIDDYYDSVGNPAMLLFRWAAIEAPDGDWRPSSD
jgi:hypothetical protein